MKKIIISFVFIFVVAASALAQDAVSVLLPPEVQAVYNYIPEKLLSVLAVGWIFWWIGSRAFKNWKAGGGWYGIRRAVLWGDKIPDAKAADDAKVSAKIEASRE
jgi:hypothetical protein